MLVSEMWVCSSRMADEMQAVKMGFMRSGCRFKEKVE